MTQPPTDFQDQRYSAGRVAQEQAASQPYNTEEEGFPSDAPEFRTQRVNAKPFGQDAAHALMVKQRALATLSRQECFDRGYLSVQDLDDEELRYGRCRDANGIIPRRNGKTELIPKHLYDEMVSEHEARYKQKLRQRTDDALDVITEIMGDDTVEPRDRFEAAKYIFERTAGKTPDQVSVTVKSAPWEDLLTQVTGIGAISREEHRRLSQEGPGTGIIDVEIVDEDDVQPDQLPADGQHSAEPDVVSVHQPRPDEHAPGRELQPLGDTQEQASQKPPAFVGQEPYYQRDPATPDGRPEDWAPVDVDTPDPYEQYGSKRTEAKTYAQQARDAVALAERRKAAKARVNDAKKQRKIARATGADAITDEITGAELGDDGQLTFE